MFVANKENESAILNFIPSMKANMSEWQIITAKVASGNKVEQKKILKRLLTIYKDKEGLLFPVVANFSQYSIKCEKD